MPKPSNKPTPKAVSMRPDEMTQGGLPDDFDGTITRVRYVPWNYDGKREQYSLSAKVDITPDDESGLEPFSQYYSCGDLKKVWPSMDGETPIGASIEDYEALAEGTATVDDESEMEGIYAISLGSGINKTSNWAHFIESAIDAGFPESSVTNDCSVFEGVTGHFNRVPQKTRSGIIVDSGDNRMKTVLVLTEVSKSTAKSKPTTSKTTTTKTTAGKSSTTTLPADTDTEEDDFDSRLRVIVREALKAAGGELPKNKLTGPVMKAFQGKEKADGVKRVVKPDFLGSDEASELWAYDADEGVLTLLD